MGRHLIVLILFIGMCKSQHAIDNYSTYAKEGIPIKSIIQSLRKGKIQKLTPILLTHITPKQLQENPKVVALILPGTLGAFGAHRIYLGTDPKIPIFYTITLGGGLGVLPAIDFFVLLFSKDLSKYYHNDKIFMWSD